MKGLRERYMDYVNSLPVGTRVPEFAEWHCTPSKMLKERLGL